MDFLSMSRAFTYTTYYDNEIGQGIRRQTAAFLNLVAPESLPDIKLRTNEIETNLLRDGKRQVNIDPGLISAERFVLATGRILRTGFIFATESMPISLSFITKERTVPCPGHIPTTVKSVSCTTLRF